MRSACNSIFLTILMHFASSRSDGHFLCSIISSRVDRKLFEISLNVRPTSTTISHAYLHTYSYMTMAEEHTRYIHPHTYIYTYTYNQIVWKVEAKWLNNDRVMTGTNFKCLICDDDDDDGKNGNRTMNPSVCMYRVSEALSNIPARSDVRVLVCAIDDFFGDKSRIQSWYTIKRILLLNSDRMVMVFRSQYISFWRLIEIYV